ncbi:EF-hand calcium-binding domain-containing protein 10 [Eucyclogobius newberryi]|uniref:EF-hand calcium-binding domain-containing protein 10 n=1 Tax=Eucyclogobius newberryi TaxID=166745 RepID=UPI003B5B7FA2
MASEREKEAKEYLEKHQILELMDNLLSLVVFHRPEEPRRFLSLQVEQLKSSRLAGTRGPILFTNNDLDSVFKVLDPARSKHVTYRQYEHALTTMGARTINECPDGVNEDKISHDTFKSEATEALHRSSQTFLKPKSSP